MKRKSSQSLHGQGSFTERLDITCNRPQGVACTNTTSALLFCVRFFLLKGSAKICRPRSSTASSKLLPAVLAAILHYYPVVSRSVLPLALSTHPNRSWVKSIWASILPVREICIHSTLFSFTLVFICHNIQPQQHVAKGRVRGIQKPQDVRGSPPCNP